MGRKAKNTQDTKLKKMMEQRGVNRKQLIELINKEFPNLPISPDAISRISNGQRKNYQISTLLRLCKCLNCTPNDILEYEHLIKQSKRNLK
tara:strand:- start:564 stop:836 length:273 start_codon:yes stop_codon:yes gene_type:complete